MSDYYTGSELSPINQNQIPMQTQMPTQPQIAVQPQIFVPPAQNTLLVKPNNMLRKLVKYLLMGLAVGFVAYHIGKGRLSTKDVVILGVTAAIVFAVLDLISPSICFA